MNREKKAKLKGLLHSVFVLGQKFKLNILPNHFYTQIPNIQELKNETYWRYPMSMAGVNGTDLQNQLSFLSSICTKEPITKLASANIHADAIKINGESGGYGTIECEVLYCFIRNVQPKRIVQVGCGVSTATILMAAFDSGYNPEIICIDPYPTNYLQRIAQEGKIKLLKEKAQVTDIAVFTSLGSNDLLFIDSTHTVKPGSEVNRIILEILPRMNTGVWVHFHDIFFPFDYRRDILSRDMFFWSETSLLHAFLINNPKYEIKVSLSMLHYHKPESVKEYFPHYEPEGNEYGMSTGVGKHFPCSIFLQTR